MKRSCAATWLLLGCSLLAGCSGLPRQRGDAGRPEEPAVPANKAPLPAVDATDALLREAAEAEYRGDADRAADLLERAIRVSPQDPLPWTRLAALHLRQGQGPQAEQLAIKSNRLAGADSALKARNWQIIAESRHLAGDDVGARAAEQEAKLLEAR